MTQRNLSSTAIGYPCPDCVNGPSPSLNGQWMWTMGGPPAEKGTGYRVQTNYAGNWSGPSPTQVLVTCDRCEGTGMVSNRRLRVSFVVGHGGKVEKVIGISEDRRKNGGRDRRG